MVYPDRLLPRPNYRPISDIEALNSYFLQRSTPDSDVIDPETNTIKPSYISFQSGHLHDLSTNLISVFVPEDRFWRIVGEKKDYYTRELWSVGETVVTPFHPNDFEYIDTLGAIYFLIHQLNGLSISYNIGDQDGFIAICKILHTPVRSNFWHFSLRWFNEEGDVLLQKGSWKKRMLTSARAALIEFGVISEPKIQKIDISLYT